MSTQYLSVSPLNPQSVEYKLASCCYISYGDSPGDIGMGGYSLEPVIQPQQVAPQPVDQFSSQNQLGTAGYSQDMAGYLNALTPQQLVSLGDNFDVSGLARSDLSRSEYDNQNLSFDDAYTLSKYRNLGDQYAGSEYGTDRYHAAYDPSLEGGPTESRLWTTRNITNPGNERYSGGNTLYGYGDDGSFSQLAERDRSGFSQSLLSAAPYLMLAATTAGFGAAAGAGAAGTGGTAGGTVGTGSGLGMGGAAGGTLGSSTSLISGANSLNLGLGSGFAGAAGAGGAGLGSTAGLAYGGALGSGVGAGLGAASGAGSTLGSSASLINGANSLNLGNVAAGRYVLPDSLQTIDYMNPLKDLAKKGIRKYLTSQGEQPQGQAPVNALSGQQAGFQGQMPGGGEQNMLRPTPYQYQDQGTANAVRGYRDYLRS